MTQATSINGQIAPLPYWQELSDTVLESGATCIYVAKLYVQGDIVHPKVCSPQMVG